MISWKYGKCFDEMIQNAVKVSKNLQMIRIQSSKSLFISVYDCKMLNDTCHSWIRGNFQKRLKTLQFVHREKMVQFFGNLGVFLIWNYEQILKVKKKKFSVFIDRKSYGSIKCEFQNNDIQCRIVADDSYNFRFFIFFISLLLLFQNFAY